MLSLQPSHCEDGARYCLNFDREYQKLYYVLLAVDDVASYCRLAIVARSSGLL